jgi:hypothetical protein
MSLTNTFSELARLLKKVEDLGVEVDFTLESWGIFIECGKNGPEIRYQPKDQSICFFDSCFHDREWTEDQFFEALEGNQSTKVIKDLRKEIEDLKTKLLIAEMPKIGIPYYPPYYSGIILTTTP